MKALINLIWNGDKLAKTIPLEVGEKGAELLLKKSQGSQFPEYIVPEDASKYNLDVKIEEVAKAKNVVKKAAPATKETSNGRPKILSKEQMEENAKAANGTGEGEGDGEVE